MSIPISVFVFKNSELQIIKQIHKKKHYCTDTINSLVPAFHNFATDVEHWGELVTYYCSPNMEPLCCDVALLQTLEKLVLLYP
jgi:hypothetical protein